MKNNLTHEQKVEVYDYIVNEGECPAWLEEWASDHFADSIPYGTLTGDTGTVDEWLCDHVDSVEDQFYDEIEEIRLERMPEGWKRFNEGGIKMVAVSDEDRKMAAELLKEMAGDMEQLLNYIINKKTKGRFSRSLVKFNNWK